MILLEKKESINSILNIGIEHFDVHQIVHSYLYFNGYFKTLDSFEQSTSLERNETFLLKKTNQDEIIIEENKKEIDEEEIKNNINDSTNDIKDLKENLINRKISNEMSSVMRKESCFSDVFDFNKENSIDMGMIKSIIYLILFIF